VVLLSYYMIEPALDYARYREITIELQIPVIWKAAPVLAAFVISIFAVLVMFVREMRAPATTLSTPPTKDPV
jgi:TRAP-type C4-dicarboxylate transport system permease small subunit